MRNIIKHINIAFFLLIMILACGCQPTPKEPIVIGKGNSLEDMILQTAQPGSLEQQIGQDEIWQEALKFNGGSVIIDATIVRPDVSAIPVLDVVPYEFTKEEARRLIDYFMHGQPIYEYQNQLTKEDCMEEILKLQAELHEVENGGGQYGSESARRSAINVTNENIKYYEKLYEQAPADIGLIPAAVEFKEVKDPLSEYAREICIQADLGKDDPAWLTISMASDNYNNAVIFNNEKQRNVFRFGLDATDTLPGQDITLQEAQAEAERLLNFIGVEAAQLYSSGVLVDVTGIADEAGYPSAVSDPERKKFYVLCYTPIYHGIPVTNVPSCSGILSEDTTTFNFIWSRESIEVWVDDNGVINFQWLSPGEAIGVVNSNVQLSDFKTVKERFRDQIAYEKEWSSGGRFTITINRIQLGYMRVKMKDTDKYRLLPVWDFIGDWDTGGVVERGVSFMTINAIDGSIINRDLGY